MPGSFDFSKPDRLLKEINDFIDSVGHKINLPDLKKRSYTLTSKDAQLMIFNLIQVVAPNFREPPSWNVVSILHLFNALGCPYTIRPDAITAVGAPSSISYLVKAIYWLY